MFPGPELESRLLIVSLCVCVFFLAAEGTGYSADAEGRWTAVRKKQGLGGTGQKFKSKGVTPNVASYNLGRPSL